MIGKSGPRTVTTAGARFFAALTRFLTVALVLVLFLGVAFFVYEGQLGTDTLTFFAGLIVGFLAHLIASEL